jgi:hypothetical protein
MVSFAVRMYVLEADRTTQGEARTAHTSIRTLRSAYVAPSRNRLASSVARAASASSSAKVWTSMRVSCGEPAVL